MNKNSLGVVENREMIIFCYSLERKFKQKNIRRIFVQEYRALHCNLFCFLLAMFIMFFLKSNDIIINLLCTALLVFSFFYKKIIYKLIIIEKRSLVNLTIQKKQVRDAEILADLFVNKNSDIQ